MKSKKGKGNNTRKNKVTKTRKRFSPSKTLRIIRPKNLALFSKYFAFVCYSHYDRKYMHELRICLKPLSSINVFYDVDIEVGQSWHETIAEALDNCKVGVLFLSPHFLASDYITEVELQRLLDRVHNNKALLCILYTTHCLAEAYNLNRFQLVNNEKTSLRGLSPNRRYEIYKSVGHLLQKWYGDGK